MTQRARSSSLSRGANKWLRTPPACCPLSSGSNIYCMPSPRGGPAGILPAQHYRGGQGSRCALNSDCCSVTRMSQLFLWVSSHFSSTAGTSCSEAQGGLPPGTSQDEQQDTVQLWEQRPRFLKTSLLHFFFFQEKIRAPYFVGRLSIQFC